MPDEHVSTLIVGGGIAGCALAHYLAEEGETGIVLVEADELGSGSTGGSFGGVRQQFSTPLEIELSRRGSGQRGWSRRLHGSAQRGCWEAPGHPATDASRRQMVSRRLCERRELPVRPFGSTGR